MRPIRFYQDQIRGRLSRYPEEVTLELTIPFLLTGVFLTSTLSGTLGMGGGMLLMGLYLHLLPVPAAMALHGLTQLAANGFRTLLHGDQVRRAILLPYLGGALLACVFSLMVGHFPSRGSVYLVLGALPFLAPLLPFRFQLEEKNPRSSVTCGLTVGLLHLTAGVSGPVLDLFFLHSPLTRRQVVATKAATQTLAHTAKLIYFLPVMKNPSQVLSPGLVLSIWVMALAGTGLGKFLLTRLSERSFRRAGTALVRLAGLIYLVRGTLLLWG